MPKKIDTGPQRNISPGGFFQTIIVIWMYHHNDSLDLCDHHSASLMVSLRRSGFTGHQDDRLLQCIEWSSPDDVGDICRDIWPDLAGDSVIIWWLTSHAILTTLSSRLDLIAFVVSCIFTILCPDATFFLTSGRKTGSLVKGNVGVGCGTRPVRLMGDFVVCCSPSCDLVRNIPRKLLLLHWLLKRTSCTGIFEKLFQGPAKLSGSETVEDAYGVDSTGDEHAELA